MFLFACVTVHELACVHKCCTCQVKSKREEERKEEREPEEAWCTEESLHVSPNWNTWLQIVGLFLVATGCQGRLLSNSECSWFSSARLLLLEYDGESCRMHAAAGDMGMYCLALIALPLCNQESWIRGDGIFPDPVLNNWAHFHDCFILVLMSDCVHLYSSFLFINLCGEYTCWFSCSTIVWTWRFLHIVHDISCINAVWCPVGK